VLRLEPDNAEAHNQLGIVLGEQGDIDGAVEQFGEALRDRPDYEAAKRNLGMALDLKSRPEQ